MVSKVSQQSHSQVQEVALLSSVSPLGDEFPPTFLGTQPGLVYRVTSL